MKELLRAEGICKSFPGVLAVDKVSLALQEGEILALVGENGAGKSTLMLILGGVLRPDRGRIYLGGKPALFSSPEEAIRAGVSMVFQELSLVGSLSVAENIFANRQPVGWLNNIRWGELHRETREFLHRFDLDLDPRIAVKNLSMGQQQILEILKAISTGPRVLILDEPTSSLTEGETSYLFNNIRKLREQGMSFIYITHKLSEVFRIADRVVVMRDGRYIGSRAVADVGENDLISMMVGRQITNLYGSSSGRLAEAEFFRVERLSRRHFFQDVSLSLHKGEILGLAGLVGAGRTQVARSIFGADPLDSGHIFLHGREIKISRPQEAIEHKIAYLTEDRKTSGLFLSMAIRENLVAPSLRRFTGALGLLHMGSIGRFADEKVAEFSIATPSALKQVLNLSGGNQQKCLLAMWMGIQPEVIILDEPTRGVDVGARADIYQKIREFAEAGTGVIIISSDLPELIGMCDRILVMHQGKVMGQVGRADFSEERILAYAAGIVNGVGA